MSRWTFYNAAHTCGQAVHIALEEAQADYDLVLLNFAATQQRSPDYLAINPKGRVPALVTQHGVLTETPALLVFIAQRFEQARLAPLHDAFAFARMQEFNSYLASTVHVAHAHGRRANRWADDESAMAAMRAKMPANMTACAQHLESLLTGPYVLGDDYSVADAYLFTVAGWLPADGVDMSALPRLSAHQQRIGQRAAVQRALAAVAPT
jgi:glutathione S-transferase